MENKKYADISGNTTSAGFGRIGVPVSVRYISNNSCLPNISGGGLSISLGRGGLPKSVEYVNGNRLVDLANLRNVTLNLGHFQTPCKAKFAQVVHRDDENPLNSIMMELYLQSDGSRIFVTYKPQEVLKNDLENKEFDYVVRRHERMFSLEDSLPSDLEDFVGFLESNGFFK